MKVQAGDNSSGSILGMAAKQPHIFKLSGQGRRDGAGDQSLQAATQSVQPSRTPYTTAMAGPFND